MYWVPFAATPDGPPAGGLLISWWWADVVDVKVKPSDIVEVTISFVPGNGASSKSISTAPADIGRSNAMLQANASGATVKNLIFMLNLPR